MKKIFKSQQRLYTLFCLIILWTTAINAQPISDSLWYWNQLNDAQLKADSSDLLNKIATRTGSLFNTNISEKNGHVIIITSEQIRRANYITLTDLLRDLPGFLVTQPGSFLQGEMFHYNGLNGNENFAILINGTPVRSTFSHGLPIAANLPIQQAMRIEIMISPQSANHANGASLGVINIITPQTERPVYIKAAIGGNTLQNNNLSLIVGGKFGNQRHPIRFDMYGNFLERSDIRFTSSDVFIDSSYNTNHYKASSSAITDPLAQSSKLLGLNAYYKQYHLSVISSAHKEQSSLGLNPLSVNTTISNHYIAEQTTVISLTSERDRARFGKVFTGLYYINYATELSSSFRYSEPALKRYSLNYTRNLLSNVPNPDSAAAFYQRTNDYLNNRYFDNVRFIQAKGYDFGIERTRKLSYKNFSGQVGFDINASLGNPMQLFNRTKNWNFIFPDTARSDIGVPFSVFRLSFNFKYGLEYTHNTWTLGALIRNGTFNNYSILKRSDTKLANSERAISCYFKKMLSSKKSLILTYNEGYTEFNAYRFANSFIVSKFNLPNQAVEINRSFLNQNPLTTKDLRISFVRWSKEIPVFYFTGFLQSSKYIPRAGLQDMSGSFLDTIGNVDFYYGYFAPVDSRRTSFGISFTTDILLELNFNVKPDKEKTEGANELHFIINGYFASSKTYLAPDFIGKKDAFTQPNSYLITEIQYHLKQKFDFSIQYHLLGKYQPDGPYQVSLGSQNFFDVLASYKLNRNFSTTLRFYNIFGAKLFGASATGTIDDLFSNPIRKELFIIKLNYVLE